MKISPQLDVCRLGYYYVSSSLPVPSTMTEDKVPELLTQRYLGWRLETGKSIHPSPEPINQLTEALHKHGEKKAVNSCPCKQIFYTQRAHQLRILNAAREDTLVFINMGARILIVSALLVALVTVLYEPAIRRTVTVLGALREPINTIVDSSNIVLIEDTVHCEDLHHHLPSNQLYTACEDHETLRFSWFPPLARFDASPVERSQGSIHVIDAQVCLIYKSPSQLDVISSNRVTS